MPKALSMLSDMDALIVEGNSAIEFSNPDIVIFLVSRDEEGMKPSAVNLLNKADIIVSASHLDIKTDTEPVSGRRVIRFDPAETSALRLMVGMMDKTAVDSRLKKMLESTASDGKITCTAARQIAESLGVPYSEIAKAANELKLKITNCELGCF
ncbi:MAG: hypothetical protein RBT37_01730 [Dissulfurispiraceae bacterium]|jgi:LAO/AO transport system kinase|nr:hypothetical protein [Dissulfurispiraceae bacterium]